MEMPKLNDCLWVFINHLQAGGKPSREYLRETFWREFGARSTDEQSTLNRLIGWCDAYLVGAGLVKKSEIPNNNLADTFEITPKGVRALWEHQHKHLFLTVGYVKELAGSRVLRGSWSDFSESWSEWAFYDHLEQLPPEYTVFHSINWYSKEGKTTEGEIDFLLAHPEKGVLVLELKGGIISVKDEGNRGVFWYSQSNTGRVSRIKDPPAQARRNAIELKQWLRIHPATKHYAYPVFHAVAFPDSEITFDLRPDSPREIMLDIHDLGRLSAQLDVIFAYHREHTNQENKVPMRGEDAVKALRAMILPTTTLEPSLSTIFEQERRKIEKFTKEQTRVLNYLRFHRRTMILGSAGTGKTVLALEKAMLLAQEGYKVLFLGYNAGLVEWVETMLAHPNITVDNLHGIVGKAMYVVGLKKEMDALDRHDFDTQLTYWLHEVTTRLQDSPALIEKYGFDALIVDEGQDFNGNQWNDLVKFLRHPIEDVLYVFADDSQRIFSDLKEKLPPLGEPFYLHENCRTTQHIHAFAQTYATMPSICEGPQGRPVQTYDANTPEAVYQKVADLLSDLVDKERIPAHEIVILTTRAPKTSLWGKEMELGKFLLTRKITSEHDPATTIRVSTVHAYKGLECGVAILTELDRAHPNSHNAILYVALTRARHAVHVVGALPPPMG
ncbi:MAG: NERD domain-containing protein [bacterium]|nr:NERD domain-containing protein [bacterium]